MTRICERFCHLRPAPEWGKNGWLTDGDIKNAGKLLEKKHKNLTFAGVDRMDFWFFSPISPGEFPKSHEIRGRVVALVFLINGYIEKYWDHWIVIVIDGDTIIYFDPANHPIHAVVKKIISNIALLKYMRTGRSSGVVYMTANVQRGDGDCGLFCLDFIDFYARYAGGETTGEAVKAMKKYRADWRSLPTEDYEKQVEELRSGLFQE